MITQHPQPDPRGWLALDGLPVQTRDAEDATAAADFERACDPDYRSGVTAPWAHRYPPDPNDPNARPSRWFTRAATATERELLAGLGYAVPDELLTVVVFFTTVRSRRWPQLEQKEMTA